MSNGTDTPLISVILPVYNVEQYIREAVDSILGQTLSDFELILVEDCSSDNTKFIAESYAIQDSRIVLIKNNRNEGIVSALNKAVIMARGKHIARMDGDDISNLKRFEKQLSFLEKNGLDIVGSQCILFKESLEKGKKLNYPCKHKICQIFMRNSNTLAHPSWFGKATVFKQLKYRNIHTCEDYDFLIRAVLCGKKVGNIPDRYFFHRDNTNSISGQANVEQYLTANLLAKCYKNRRILSMDEYEMWKMSDTYKNQVQKIEKQKKNLDKAKQMSKHSIIRIILVVSNGFWVKQKWKKWRNNLMIKWDRISEIIDNKHEAIG